MCAPTLVTATNHHRSEVTPSLTPVTCHLRLNPARRPRCDLLLPQVSWIIATLGKGRSRSKSRVTKDSLLCNPGKYIWWCWIRAVGYSACGSKAAVSSSSHTCPMTRHLWKNNPRMSSCWTPTITMSGPSERSNVPVHAKIAMQITKSLALQTIAELRHLSIWLIGGSTRISIPSHTSLMNRELTMIRLLIRLIIHRTYQVICNASTISRAMQEQQLPLKVITMQEPALT